MNIAEKIKSARMEKGLTQKDLGEALCISDKAVSKWERGVAMPDITTIPELCRVLAIEANELFAEDSLAEKPVPIPSKRKRLLISSSAISAVIIAAIVVTTVVASNLKTDNNKYLYKQDPYYHKLISEAVPDDIFPYYAEAMEASFSFHKYDYNEKTISRVGGKEIMYAEILPLMYEVHDKEARLSDPEPLGERKITAEYGINTILSYDDETEIVKEGVDDYWYEIDGEIYRSERNESLMGSDDLSQVEFHKLTPLRQKIFRKLIK